MDLCTDSNWCTIKEFCRITSWQLSERRLRQIIKENCFPYPAKKLRQSSKSFQYLIQLTDPKQLAALRRLREMRHVRKKANTTARKVFGDKLIHDSELTIRKWRTIRVPIRGYDYLFIQSNEFLRSLYDYIKKTGNDIPTKKEKFGSIFICVPQDVYDKLSKVSKKGSCSIGDALHIMILEFMKTQQGRAAAIFTTKLSHPGLDRNR
jgi:hypothetical protein